MILRILIFVFTFGVILLSCSKSEDNKIDNESIDKTIPIDENSAFNMKNFIISFDQIFVSNERWAWSTTHEFVDGKLITSDINRKIHGVFGDEIFITTHNYNENGIIVSSSRTSNRHGYEESNFFTYDYDLSGFIIEITKSPRNIVNFEYLGNYLMKKIHIPGHGYIKEESFTYDSDRNVKSYYENSHEYYTYSNGNMVKQYQDDNLTIHSQYEYDNLNRIVKSSMSYQPSNTIYEYSSDLMTAFRYEKSKLIKKSQYRERLIKVNYWYYNYDDNDVFENCTATELSNNGKHVKVYYYEGSINNLELVGYSTIEYKDDLSFEKTKECIYNSNDTKLYYVIFTVIDEDNYKTVWYKPDGTRISLNEINEDWVMLLHKSPSDDEY